MKKRRRICSIIWMEKWQIRVLKGAFFQMPFRMSCSFVGPGLGVGYSIPSILIGLPRVTVAFDLIKMGYLRGKERYL